jgi:hypothetical protein
MGLGACRVATTADNVGGFSLTRAKSAAVFEGRAHLAHTAGVCAFLSVFHDRLSSVELDTLILALLRCRSVAKRLHAGVALFRRRRTVTVSLPGRKDARKLG